MRNGWILTLAFFVLVSGLAFATTPTISITTTLPVAANPAVAPVPLNFTLQNTNAGTGTDAMNVDIVASTDATYDASDVVIAPAANASTFCSGATDYTSAQNCTFAWSGATSAAEGTTYLIVHAVISTGSNESNAVTSNSFLLDKTIPTASITSPTNGAVLTTLLPTFTITGDPGTGSNLTIGSFTLNTHPHVLTFTSNVATYTADPSDGLVAGQTYTASLDTVVDAAGNHSASLGSISFSIGNGSPTNVAASSGASNSYTNDKTPSITVSADDTVGGLIALVKCDGVANYTEVPMSSNSFVVDTFDVTTNGCPTSDGERTLKINVKNALGNMGTETSLIVKYDGGKPPAPTNVDSESTNNNNVTITWTGVSDVSGISSYHVFRGTTNTFSSATDVSNTSNTSVVVSGLSSCTTYLFWVVSKDNAGNTSDPQSSPHSATTSGCSNNNNNDNSNNSGSGGSGGSGGSSGGGGGGECSVTFDIPTHMYEGDTYTVKVSGASYANGYFRVTPTGKPTQSIEKSGLAKTSWSGSYTAPKAGLALKFVFGSDACTSITSRTVEPQSAKPATGSSAKKPTTTTPTTNTLNEDAGTDEKTTPPSEATIAYSIDKIPGLLTLAGFNAENTQQRTAIEGLISGMGLVEIIHVVPSGTDGKYAIEVVLRLTNKSNVGTLKVVQSLPKSFVESATQLESNYPMTVLQDDPLVQFEISDLSEGQAIEIRMTSKETYSVDAANAKVDALKNELTTPPLLFASGTAKPASGSGLASISGLIGAAGTTAPYVLGFVLVLGLIFVSVRVVRGSVEGSNNPILRSASQASMRSDRTVTRTVNARKRFAQNRPDDAA